VTQVRNPAFGSQSFTGSNTAVFISSFQGHRTRNTMAFLFATALSHTIRRAPQIRTAELFVRAIFKSAGIFSWQNWQHQPLPAL